MKEAGAAGLPWTSTALQVTVVSPSGKVTPEAGEQLTATRPSTTSVADGSVYVTMAPAGEVASAVISVCVAITGPVLSTTWMTKLVGPAALPCVSVALQMTVVSPRVNSRPEAGEQVAVPGASTMS